MMKRIAYVCDLCGEPIDPQTCIAFRQVPHARAEDRFQECSPETAGKHLCLTCCVGLNALWNRTPVVRNPHDQTTREMEKLLKEAGFRGQESRKTPKDS